MKTLYNAAIAALILSLTACGGGGGGSTGGGGITPPTSAPTSSASPSDSITNASGTVVNDANGSPLAGVPVKLMPWGPCGATPSPATITPEADGCPTPLPSPQATTSASGQFTLRGAPNGHYVLVIGSDAVATPPAGYTPPTCTTTCGTPSPAPFVTVATVHDNVSLSGGDQILIAPTLPTVASGYTPPIWETNGDYRLATLNASTEMPCYVAWEYARTQNGYAGSSVDEWLTENERANTAHIIANNGGTVVGLTSGGGSIAGGTSCDEWIEAQPFGATFTGATDPRALWFGAAWELWEKSGTTFYQGLGLAQFVTDPRSYTDPKFPTWP